MSQRLLLVDDNELLRRGMRRLLTSRGWAVVEANGSADVPWDERFDAALVDMNLETGESGFDLAARLREREVAVRVVLYSGEADPSRGVLCKTQLPQVVAALRKGLPKEERGTA